MKEPHRKGQATHPSRKLCASGDNAYDPLYRRASVAEDSPAAAIAGWSFFGPSRVAEVQLGNGLISTWMNNARSNSAVQPGVPNPAWGDQLSDRLGYDGSGRAITKPFLARGTGGGGYNNSTPVAGFTTADDFSAEHRRQLRTNTMLERRNRELERRKRYLPYSNALSR